MFDLWGFLLQTLSISGVAVLMLGMLPCRAGDAFEVVDADAETVVYEGVLALKAELDASDSGEAMLTADFSLPLMEHPTVRLDVSGGWHDAGEIGKCVIPGADAYYEILGPALLSETSKIEIDFTITGGPETAE